MHEVGRDEVGGNQIGGDDIQATLGDEAHNAAVGKHIRQASSSSTGNQTFVRVDSDALIYHLNEMSTRLNFIERDVLYLKERQRNLNPFWLQILMLVVAAALLALLVIFVIEFSVLLQKQRAAIPDAAQSHVIIRK